MRGCSLVVGREHSLMRDWLFRTVQVAWPRAFRDRHGHSLYQTMRADWQAEAARPLMGRLWHRGAMLLDVLRAGVDDRRDVSAARPAIATRVTIMFRNLTSEIRLAVRGLVKRPGFTAAVVLTLSLGVGATTGISSVVYGVLFRDLPFNEAEQLVVVWESNPSSDLPYMKVAPPNLEDWRAGATALDDIGAYATSQANMMTPAGGELLRVARSTTNLLDVLQVVPVAGRSFIADDGRAGAAPVALLTEASWRRFFGQDPAVLGQTFDVDGQAVEVVGILPSSFEFPLPIVRDPEERSDPVDAFIALRADDLGGRTSHYLYAIGRLRAGVPLAAARDQLTAIADGLERQYPESNTGWTVRVEAFDEAVTGQVRPALLALLGAVALVLLLACTNAAHLLLARALDRRRDVAVRTALGASRLRLARQFLIEGLLLAAMGAAGGLVLAAWSVRVLLGVAPASIPRLGEVGLDGVTLTVAVCASIGAALAASLAPITHAWRARTGLALRDRSASSTPGVRMAHRFVVVGEAAMAIVLVVMASLLGRSFLELRGIDPGFQPDNVLVFHANLSGPAYDTADARTAFLEDALAQLGALPGVVGAGTVDVAPLAGDRQGTQFTIEGAPPFPLNAQPVMNFSWVSPGYFEVMGSDLLEGRTFTAADREGSEPVTIINESFANEYFPDGDAVGRQLRLGFNTQTPRTIVGIVADERHESLQGDLFPATYTPVYQFSFSRLAFVIKSESDPTALVEPVRDLMRGLDRQLALYDIKPMTEVVAAKYGTSRFAAGLLSSFAALALVLAIAGVFGVASHGVSARRVEIGVRVALGAAPRDVRRAVVRPTLTLVAIGVGVGLAVTVLLAGVLDQLLVGISPVDPAAYVTAIVVVLAAGLVATWLPARRASRIDPLLALRSD
jgi:predicted permease